MCLYPRYIKNPKYKPNKKNGGNVPVCKDERVKFVPIGCGECMECRAQKSREWSVRLAEELKDCQGKASFVTLTFSEDSIKSLGETLETGECNAIAGLAIRRFLERYRKKYKKSVKHWLITELGHEGTERIHIHGIIFKRFELEELKNLWAYGRADNGKYCTQKSINYIVKYVTKVDEAHKGFKPQIFCSAGIGSGYTEKRTGRGYNRYNGEKTREYYRFENGTTANLPIYYRNKIYNEEQREKLWLNKLDKQVRYVDKVEIDVSKSMKKYYTHLKNARIKNKRLGYGSLEEEWKKKEYNATATLLIKKNVDKVVKNFQNGEFDNMAKNSIFAKETKKKKRWNTSPQTSTEKESSSQASETQSSTAQKHNADGG